MAAVLFKQKAGAWPPRDIKPMPERHERDVKLRVLYPGFAGQKTQEKPLFE
jgi:hypothetical protein